MEVLEAGASGIYEILLIVLVLVLIFNGLLRNRIMRDHINDSNKPRKTTPSKKKAKKVEGGDYVDYEVIDD